jgi:pimeloyl-ACP methyl ester carboxylesterase
MTEIKPTQPKFAPRRPRALAMALVGVCAAAVLGVCSGAVRASPSGSPAHPATSPDVVNARTRVAHTPPGPVGYREVGSGSPLLLIMGFSGSMDYWPPSFIDALAAHHTVVVFDNAGVGRTSALNSPLTITAMANQTSALIAALRLHRPAVLGWSMGGMIAQALAVLHPRQVRRLILAATQAGTGRSLPIPPGPAAIVAGPNPAAALSVIFPRNQTRAAQTYVTSILEYKPFYTVSTATKSRQTAAIARWMAGKDRAGRKLASLRVPTLVADGTLDELDPTFNDRLLAKTIPGARLTLYPDAGHAFLFQDAPGFEAKIERFLK